MALWSRRRAWCDGSMFIGAEVRLGLGFNAAQRRVAQATIRKFTHRIAAAITDPAAALRGPAEQRTCKTDLRPS